MGTNFYKTKQGINIEPLSLAPSNLEAGDLYVDGYLGQLRFSSDGLTTVAFPSSGALVIEARTIGTSLPLLGGGDLSANRTLSMPKSTTLVDGYLASTDFTTFNNKVPTTITIGTSLPLLGGGDLSANRTLSMPKSTTLVDGYLASTDFTTFNNKVPTTITIGTSLPLLGGGDLSANRTLSMPKSTTLVDGYLASTDFTTFNNKLNTSFSNVSGTLVEAYGGTGVTSVTTNPTALAFAGWDVDKNLSTNSLIQGYTTTATSAGTTTLTVGSTNQQHLTGTTTQNVKLPVVSTLILGQSFQITNRSTGIVTVQSSGSNNIQAQAPDTVSTYTCILTSGTSAASWSVSYSTAQPGGTIVQTVSSNITLSSGTTYLVSTVAPRTLTLPPALNNAIIYIKDKSGSAATNNITLLGDGATIDGAASLIFAKNWGTWAAVSDGLNWYLVVNSTTVFGP